MKPGSPVVSILIPAYNADCWLSDALRSALMQTYQPLDIVVVDDGSTDDTLAVANSFRKCGVRVIHQLNAGACAARNRALSAAKGEYVKFLDGDDALSRDAISTQMDALAAYGSDPWIIPYGDAVATDDHLRPTGSFLTTAPRPEQVISLDLAERVVGVLAHNIQTSLPLHRKFLLQKVGGFREDLRRGQEYDLHLRLALAGVRFLHVAHISSYIRQHSSKERISNTTPLVSDPSGFLSVQIERREMLEAYLGKPLPQSVADVLAQSMWRHARQLLQSDADEIADQYIAEAVRLDPHGLLVGRVFHKLALVVGHKRAENVLGLVRKLRKSFVGM